MRPQPHDREPGLFDPPPPACRRCRTALERPRDWPLSYGMRICAECAARVIRDYLEEP